MDAPFVDFRVHYDELADGRYVAWAEFPHSSQSDETLVAPSDDCRNTLTVFERAGLLLVDAGYSSCTVERMERR